MKRQLALWIVSMMLVPPQSVGEHHLINWMVWDDNGKCEFTIRKGPRVWVEAPMVEGKPDKSRAVLRGLVIGIEDHCGRIEVR